MPIPCEQEQTIREIRDDQRRMMQLLEQVARQDERLKSQGATLERHEGSINGLYSRVRKIEEAPGSTASRAWWVIFGGATAALGGLFGRLVG